MLIKKIFIYSLMIFFIFYVLNCNSKSPNNSNSSKPIVVLSGIVNGYQCTEQNDYLIEGIVTIPEGYELSISGEVAMYLANQDAKILVRGKITAYGIDSTKSISFKPQKDDMLINTAIELNNADWSSFKFCNFSNMKYGVLSNNTNFFITNCMFNNCTKAIIISKSEDVSIVYNYYHNCDTGVSIDLSDFSSDSIEIKNCQFNKCKNYAVEINRTHILNLDICSFFDCGTAIYATDESKFQLNNSIISNSETGVLFDLSAYGYLAYNTIESCKYNIHIRRNCFPRIEYNNILYPTKFSIFTEFYWGSLGAQNMDTVYVKNNYWGETNDSNINRYIYDNKDNSNNFVIIIYQPIQESMIIN